MRSSTLSLLGLASTLAHAQVEPSPPTLGQRFGVTATGSGIPGNTQLTASAGRILVGGAQTPTCEDDARQDYATFALYSDGALYLWGPNEPAVQQVWVDASGMGQGVTGYSTGDAGLPTDASQETFAVDAATGALTFNGVGAKACPTGAENEWSLWFTTSETPAWQTDCVCVELTAYAADARVGCTYTPSE